MAGRWYTLCKFPQVWQMPLFFFSSTIFTEMLFLDNFHYITFMEGSQPHVVSLSSSFFQDSCILSFFLFLHHFLFPDFNFHAYFRDFPHRKKKTENNREKRKENCCWKMLFLNEKTVKNSLILWFSLFTVVPVINRWMMNVDRNVENWKAKRVGGSGRVGWCGFYAICWRWIAFSQHINFIKQIEWW